MCGRAVWAFKYNSNNTGPASRGVKIHADMAAVNVNFWVTPDDAVLDKETGGLIVYEDEAAAGADFAGYNSAASESVMKELVKDSPTYRVPYKENRLVLFNSSARHIATPPPSPQYAVLCACKSSAELACTC
jgi:hypothetical protein